jgi:hypothetical protein
MRQEVFTVECCLYDNQCVLSKAGHKMSDIPQPRAVGWVVGRIISFDESDKRGRIELEDGTVLNCFVNYRKAQELFECPEKQLLTVYPGFFRDQLFLKICRPIPNNGQALGFRINAEIIKVKEGLLYLAVRSERREKVFNVTLHGYLPSAKTGEYWKFEADIEDKKLVMIDAEKIANAPPPPRVSKPEQMVSVLEEASEPFVAQVIEGITK